MNHINMILLKNCCTKFIQGLVFFKEYNSISEIPITQNSLSPLTHWYAQFWIMGVKYGILVMWKSWKEFTGTSANLH